MTRTLEELREYLVGEWKFDNNFLDSSGNGNHGTPTDIEWKPTARGLKPYFNGSSSYIKANTILKNLDSFTLNIVFKMNYIRDSETTAVVGDTYYGEYTIGIQIDPNKKLLFRDYYNSGYITYGDILEYDRWYSTTISYDADQKVLKMFFDGILRNSRTDYTPASGVTHDFRIGATTIRHLGGNVAVTNVYSTALTDDEVLALYNSTKHAFGVRPVERSFTHRLQPDVDDNTVFATDMSTKNSDGTLMDLSGNSNHGDIQGAVRAGGYFTDGMRFDGVDDIIDCGNSDSLDISSQFKLSALIYPNELTGVIMRKSGAYVMYFVSGLDFYNWSDGSRLSYPLSNMQTGRYYLIEFVWDGEYKRIFIDGNEVVNEQSVDFTINDTPLTIGKQDGDYPDSAFDGHILFASVSTNLSDTHFNSLATLPLYTFDASKYPTSDGWTTNVPYSSMSISSGEFSFTDSGQLQCDSSGSFSLRNAHEFDGDEYIKVTIDGVEYAGTGSVTQGNVTVAITQSSTKIDVDMGTSDLIDGIDIQFREPVE
jgi:hypothetical protein